MPLFARTPEEIIGEMLNEVTTSTRLTRVTPGSKTRSLLEVVKRHLGQAYSIFDLNLARAFLNGATGRYIDYIGELMNIKRLGLATAKTTAAAENIKFYVEEGTFGDINNGAAITLPIGTLITTEPNGTGVGYKLTTGAVLSPSLSEQFVTAEAITPGSNSNVGQHNLIHHEFIDYEDSNNTTLLVTNESAILNGANIETDNNYKFRISQSATASEAANQTAVLLAALSVPGVANVVLENRASGIGTCKVYIKSITPTVSAQLISDVDAIVQDVIAAGNRGEVTRPDETGMSFDISITYEAGLTDAEKDEIDDQMEIVITDHVNNLDIGEDFIIDDLVDRILSVSPQIKRIGIPGTPLDGIFLHTETRLQDNKIRQELLTDYETSTFERLIIEPSLGTPIAITRNN